MSPMTASLAPSACEKSGNTGFFEMVVEKIAKKPSRNRVETANLSVVPRVGDGSCILCILVGGESDKMISSTPAEKGRKRMALSPSSTWGMTAALSSLPLEKLVPEQSVEHFYLDDGSLVTSVKDRGMLSEKSRAHQEFFIIDVHFQHILEFQEFPCLANFRNSSTWRWGAKLSPGE